MTYRQERTCDSHNQSPQLNSAEPSLLVIRIEVVVREGLPGAHQHLVFSQQPFYKSRDTLDEIRQLMDMNVTIRDDLSHHRIVWQPNPLLPRRRDFISQSTAPVNNDYGDALPNNPQHLILRHAASARKDRHAWRACGC